MSPRTKAKATVAKKPAAKPKALSDLQVAKKARALSELEGLMLNNANAREVRRMLKTQLKTQRASASKKKAVWEAGAGVGAPSVLHLGAIQHPSGKEAKLSVWPMSWRLEFGWSMRFPPGIMERGSAKTERAAKRAAKDAVLRHAKEAVFEAERVLKRLRGLLP
jgi:hypothetical protein